MKAKKRYGQNFLTNSFVIQKIVDQFKNLSFSDEIIEIGPGYGALTEFLLKKHTLKLVEIDKDCYISLINKFPNVNVINDDFLSIDLSIFKNNNYIVSNLPYNVASPILFKICLNLSIKLGVFMLQKEMAERLFAKPKSSKYNNFTVFFNTFYDVKKVCYVSKSSFDPKPKVDSIVFSITEKNIISINKADYSDFLRKLFSNKRKLLSYSLFNNLNIDKVTINKLFNNLVIQKNARAEELDLDTIVKIYNKLCDTNTLPYNNYHK